MRRHCLIVKSQMVSGSTECHKSLLGAARWSIIGIETWVDNNDRGDNKVDNNVGDDIEDMPVRKLFNYRGPLSIDVSSAWYFIRICDDGHAPWIADEVKVGRAVAPRSPSIELMAEKRSVA